MDKLQAMTTFVRVVQAQSFSKAAATLALPRSSVTTTIKQLEALWARRCCGARRAASA